eukprot:jgi/Undpi1/7043/HiC_scaffold_21.g09517.m1
MGRDLFGVVCFSPCPPFTEQRRLSQVNEVIKRRRSVSGHSRPDVAPGSTDAVITVHKMEEDSRLLARLGAFELPILVSTLLAGFTLVMFDVVSTNTARGLAVVAFGLESSASIVLCLIAFRGQQLYSNSTDINPLTRKFLRRMCPVIIVALLAFTLGVVAFVLAFILEASEELGASWIAVMAIVFCPTLLVGALFALSTVGSGRSPVAGDTPGME